MLHWPTWVAIHSLQTLRHNGYLSPVWYSTFWAKKTIWQTRPQVQPLEHSLHPNATYWRVLLIFWVGCSLNDWTVNFVVFRCGHPKLQIRPTIIGMCRFSPTQRYKSRLYKLHGSRDTVVDSCISESGSAMFLWTRPPWKQEKRLYLENHATYTNGTCSITLVRTYTF